jgi:two-component system, OmpR family, KDP operon response regulator KdpE
MNKSDNVVLLIDDDQRIRRFIRVGLQMSGYTVLEAENGIEGLKYAKSNKPDLVILDIVLPDIHGREVLGALRSSSSTPVIILSVVSNDEEKVQFLEAGADDYVVKPFGMPELVARCEAALRRHFKTAVNNHIIVAGGRLSINLANHAVDIDTKAIKLTRKEYDLLAVLASHLGLAVSYEHLIEKIWPEGGRDHLRDLRYLARNLREKIELDPKNPRLVVTELGVGYRLSP